MKIHEALARPPGNRQARLIIVFGVLGLSLAGVLLKQPLFGAREVVALVGDRPQFAGRDINNGASKAELRQIRLVQERRERLDAIHAEFASRVQLVIEGPGAATAAAIQSQKVLLAAVPARELREYMRTQLPAFVTEARTKWKVWRSANSPTPDLDSLMSAGVADVERLWDGVTETVALAATLSNLNGSVALVVLDAISLAVNAERQLIMAALEADRDIKLKLAAKDS
jgi:hypothetical protein